VRVTGWWYYFPMAILFKTPLVTVGAIALALTLAVRRVTRAAAITLDDWWKLACLLTPVVVYTAFALRTNLNLGLRHMFPVYPFIFLLVGWSVASVRWRWFKQLAIAMVMLLAAETALAFPDFIPFFNAAFKPHRLKLLGDSNLDWGQDLPLLARWQEANPGKRLYLAYFGSAPPDVYGIRYDKIPGGYFLRPDITWPDEPGAVIAISATLLQGIHVPPSLQKYYAPLRAMQPREILGGSIYLYDVPQPPLKRITWQDLANDPKR
jgi:hypothetical protein